MKLYSAGLVCLFMATFACARGAFAKATDAADSIPKGQFRQQFEKNFLKGFCEESKFPSECYDMNAQTCGANVRASFVKCFKESPSGETISKEKATAYGAKLGRCVGENFQARNKSKLRKTNECQNPIDWLGQ